MKLESLHLKESQGIDAEYLDKFRDEVGTTIQNFDKTMFNVGLKIEEMTTLMGGDGQLSYG